MCSLIAAGLLLALPASSLGASRTYAGDFTGDTSSAASLTFGAAGKVRHGKFVPVKVRNFDVAVQFSCFDAAGHQISTARRDDLAPGFFSGVRVRKGYFQGVSTTPTGLTYSGSGHFNRKGRANGVLAITQGQRGTDGYCTTGTFGNASIEWRAKPVPLACSAVSAAPLCATPRPY
jgi:hypothetical protein